VQTLAPWSGRQHSRAPGFFRTETLEFQIWGKAEKKEENGRRGRRMEAPVEVSMKEILF